MNSRESVRGEINQMIRENVMVVVVSIVVALFFVGLAQTPTSGDSAGIAYFGAVIFALIALAYGSQAISFRRRMKKAGL